LDAISLLTPHTKSAIRPSSNDPSTIADAIYNAYRICWYGRPGPSFVDLPADLILNPSPPTSQHNDTLRTLIAPPPKPTADPTLITRAATLLRTAHSPLIILGKGAAYSRSEDYINTLISNANIPFLPTPMGKGIVPDSSPLNASSARSTALRAADVILLLGARLNWILHFGVPPKFRADVKIIQVDISAEELGRTNGNGEPALSIHADIEAMVQQLSRELGNWKAFPTPNMAEAAGGSFPAELAAAAARNEKKALAKSLKKTVPGAHLTYERAFEVIKSTLHKLSPPEDGGIVYISEGANTMDISRSAFPLSKPRQRLDAGTYATMGVGMGYCIAAHAAYNWPERTKKIVALEGDSAVGFSVMEIETMSRMGMDGLVFVMNNSGVYHGDSESGEEWFKMRGQSLAGETAVEDAERKREQQREQQRTTGRGNKKGLRSTSLWYETRYEMLAEMVGGKGYFVRTEEELEKATREGFLERERVVVVNVVVEPGLGKTISFAWQQAKEKHIAEAEGKGRERESKL
jgi:2-hydroxyacyl-CoA lyase 1